MVGATHPPVTQGTQTPNEGEKPLTDGEIRERIAKLSEEQKKKIANAIKSAPVEPK